MKRISRGNAKQSIRDVLVGTDVRIYDFVNLYGCSIGNESQVGAFVEIQRGAIIGIRCKIQSHSFICEGVTIGDEVFIGHGVIFTNDMHPRAINKDGTKQTDKDWSVIKTSVGRGASIGSGAVILPGAHIGARAVIGAGAVVTKPVPAGITVAGNPARPIKKSRKKGHAS